MQTETANVSKAFNIERAEQCSASSFKWIGETLLLHSVKLFDGTLRPQKGSPSILLGVETIVLDRFLKPFWAVICGGFDPGLFARCVTKAQSMMEGMVCWSALLSWTSRSISQLHLPHGFSRGVSIRAQPV